MAQIDPLDQGVLDEVKNVIAEQKRSIELFLAEGGARNEEVYWKNVGMYNALSGVREEIDDLCRRYIES